MLLNRYITGAIKNNLYFQCGFCITKILLELHGGIKSGAGDPKCGELALHGNLCVRAEVASVKVTYKRRGG